MVVRHLTNYKSLVINNKTCKFINRGLNFQHKNYIVKM